ncbi:hypothetical protein MRB53_006736 [Persea americana]|uniref:Uncharacterized protein n=1 Tax=Persea americana TaxID=3435 RepID=A0ACC2MHI3_PERAE|nr:hypothetical protein MRB53_006736 [Persea americana]
MAPTTACSLQQRCGASRTPKPFPSCYLLPLRFLRRRSTAHHCFFYGSGDLLLRRDQIPFNPIGALFLPPISAGDT